MDDCGGGVVIEGARRCPAATSSQVGVGRDGFCDDSSVIYQPKSKKQKKFKSPPPSLNNSDENDDGLGPAILVEDREVDEPQLQLPQYFTAAVAAAAVSASEAQHKACFNGREAAGGVVDDSAGGGAEADESRIQIPGRNLHLSETTTTGNEEDAEDGDGGEGELIPEFDPDGKGNSLFTDELRAAVEEGSVLQLPPMMTDVGDPPHFSSDRPLLLGLANESKEAANVNGGGGGFPLITTVLSRGLHDGTTDHLDVIAYKIYAALQQASTYPSAVTKSQAGQGPDQYQLPVDQEQGGDKNPAGIDEGERTPRHPRWTREETTVLLAGKRKRDEEIRALQSGSKFTSATERWDSISNYCKAHGVDRDAHQCRKRWSNLAADFKKIRNWHKQSGVESYWSMRGDNRRKNKLPGSFDPEVYANMEAISDCNALKKRKFVSPGTADVEEHQHDPLASVLESSGRAMQAALARNIQAQIEAQNQNSELDRVQRKEQSDNLVGVLGLLADSLARIAEKL